MAPHLLPHTHRPSGSGSGRGPADAYGAAVARTIEIAKEIADGIRNTDGLDLLLGPQLTVILFRPKNLSDATMDAWAEVHRRSGDLLCLPTSWKGQKVFRLCIVNPQTDPEEVLRVIRTLNDLQP